MFYSTFSVSSFVNYVPRVLALLEVHVEFFTVQNRSVMHFDDSEMSMAFFLSFTFRLDALPKYLSSSHTLLILQLFAFE